jgi:tetratricopeptide (TPR) repeat protein
LYEQGNIYSEAKDFASAKKFYEYSIKADPNFALGHNGLGFAYFKLGGLDSAEAEYNEALKRDPKLAVAYNNLGIVYYHKYGFWGSSESSSLDIAIDYYKKAIELKPDYAKAMVNMSVAYSKKGDLWNAFLTYQKAAETDAKYVDERKQGEQAQKEINDLKSKYPNIDIKALEAKYGSGEGK